MFAPGLAYWSEISVALVCHRCLACLVKSASPGFSPRERRPRPPYFFPPPPLFAHLEASSSSRTRIERPTIESVSLTSRPSRQPPARAIQRPKKDDDSGDGKARRLHRSLQPETLARPPPPARAIPRYCSVRRVPSARTAAHAHHSGAARRKHRRLSPPQKANKGRVPHARIDPLLADHKTTSNNTP